MKKSRHTDEQIAFALKQAGVGAPVAAVIRGWVCGGLEIGELRRVKQLEDETGS